MKFAAFFLKMKCMTKDELKALIAEMQDRRRKAHVEPTAVGFMELTDEVSSRAIDEMKRNLRALYDAKEIVAHRTINGTSIELS